MVYELLPIDLVALAWFLAAWMGYGLVFDHRDLGQGGINHEMKGLRLAWMHRMLERDNRIIDSQLVGHTIHSTSFFASTTMLILAGLIGVIGSGDRAYGVVAEISVAVQTTRATFELKLFLLLAIFVYAFFQFTWALRQFNYLCALIGAAPLPPVAEPVSERSAEQLATLLTLAITSLNRGTRAYYFALAALTWFIQPWVFMAATLGMLLVLLRRQFLSRAYTAIATQKRIVHHATRRARK